MPYLADLYTQHAALSLEKQLALGEVIGANRFAFDADAGTLSFGPALSFPMQVLGTVSRQSSTWLWAWASPHPLAPALLQAAHQLRALGQRTGIEELLDEGFDLVLPATLPLQPLSLPQQDPLDGHYLAMLAAGVCGADAYYGADYDRGIAYVLLPHVPQLAAHPRDTPAELAAVFTRLRQLPYALDQRAAFGAYLQQKGYAAEQRGQQVRGTKGPGQLLATFDGAGCLTALEADGQAGY